MWPGLDLTSNSWSCFSFERTPPQLMGPIGTNFLAIALHWYACEGSTGWSMIKIFIISMCVSLVCSWALEQTHRNLLGRYCKQWNAFNHLELWVVKLCHSVYQLYVGYTRALRFILIVQHGLNWNGREAAMKYLSANQIKLYTCTWSGQMGIWLILLLSIEKSFSTQIYLKQSIFPLENVILPPTTTTRSWKSGLAHWHRLMH